MISGVKSHGIHLPHGHGKDDHDHEHDHSEEGHHRETNSFASQVMQMFTSEIYSLEYNVYISIFLVSLPSI
jgi:zinc transporter ZupT